MAKFCCLLFTHTYISYFQLLTKFIWWSGATHAQFLTGSSRICGGENLVNTHNYHDTKHVHMVQYIVCIIIQCLYKKPTCIYFLFLNPYLLSCSHLLNSIGGVEPLMLSSTLYIYIYFFFIHIYLSYIQSLTEAQEDVLIQGWTVEVFAKSLLINYSLHTSIGILVSHGQTIATMNRPFSLPHEQICLHLQLQSACK